MREFLACRVGVRWRRDSVETKKKRERGLLSLSLFFSLPLASLPWWPARPRRSPSFPSPSGRGLSSPGGAAASGCRWTRGPGRIDATHGTGAGAVFPVLPGEGGARNRWSHVAARIVWFRSRRSFALCMRTKYACCEWFSGLRAWLDACVLVPR